MSKQTDAEIDLFDVSSLQLYSFEDMNTFTAVGDQEQLIML